MIDGLADLIPKRSAEDIFAGRILVDLGGVTYTLPVRSRKANREWRESLDGQFVGMLAQLDSLDSPTAIIGLLVSASDRLLDALVAYDATGALPTRDAIDEQATEVEIIRAILEVWMAANPLVAIGLELAPRQSAPPIPLPTSSRTQPAPSAGRRRRSSKTSPTSS